MKKQQSRRNFLKLTLAVASQVPLIGWSQGFKTLHNEGMNPAGEFSLLKLEKILSGYQFPFIQQFSTDAFSSAYQLYNLGGNKSGEFFLKSEKEGLSRNFEFLNWRKADNGIVTSKQEFKYFVSGKIKCKSDTAFSPENWEVSSRIALSEKGAAYSGTGLLNKGTVRGQDILIETPLKSIKKTIENNSLSWKWGLIAVVQQMAESSIDELQFDMLDEFDIVHPNQVLKKKKRLKIDCGDNHLIDFHVFERIGEGSLPTIYWVDQWNRTTFVVSGMEAFVLKS